MMCVAIYSLHDKAATVIYTLSLHDDLPIYSMAWHGIAQHSIAQRLEEEAPHPAEACGWRRGGGSVAGPVACTRCGTPRRSPTPPWRWSC